MSRERNCIDECMNRAYATISPMKSKDMCKIMDQLNKEGHLSTLCRKKCHIIENSRTYAKCERRKREECGGSKECIKERCSNDFRVKVAKAVFY
ncbi:hypothetical protein [Brazilian marseillevirus]|uniref:hypothetical protein n=1 Tax=Brazilian marseillevirus TaxID=1813599 RepID=UPI00078154C9|nr:hypothetical protein A3303_gp226 [Brazilian marseillevirus]AMQ10734.1 hypothetical protein [Brazilian marseillevirus]